MPAILTKEPPPVAQHNRDYIAKLRKWKIAHLSATLAYDTTTNTKKCIHPPGWQNTTFTHSSFQPSKNAIIQITGTNSNIIVVDIDGIEHLTNIHLITLCMASCKFYNKTKKGYHFFYKYTDAFPKSQSIKYDNDATNSGLDLKSTNGCVYYGTYYINDILVKYENLQSEDITPMPPILIKELQALFTKSNKPNQRKTAKYPNTITNTTTEFPNTTIIDIPTLDNLIACFPSTYFDNYNNWISICFLIKQSNHTEPAFHLFYKYSKSVAKYSNVSESECRDKWNSIKYEPDFAFQEMLFIARRNNAKLFKTISLPWLNTQQQAFYPTKFNNQYLDYDFIYPYYETNKVLAIKSPYGTGKTHFISKLFENLEPNISVLFITPRVSLSYSHKQSFPQFFHYQNKTITEITEAKKLIIQLDSIYKLDNTKKTDQLKLNRQFIQSYLPVALDTPVISTEVIKYDIIALDEIESLLYHLSFEKLNSQHIFSILKRLCIDASKIIALDGDFSNRSHYFLNKLISNEQQMIILENEYQPPPKHFIFTNDQGKFYKQIDDDLKKGSKLVLICLTLETSEFFRAKYETQYKVVIHNSIQNDRIGLTNVNEYWKCDLLIYTSTVESGCDHNIPWFNNCFIILSNKGTTPRALMQMCNRVRQFSDNKVFCYTNGVPFYEFQIPYQFDEVKNTLFKNMLNDNGQLNYLDTILCYNEVETLNKQYFITILTQLILSKGHTYEYQRIDKPNNTKIKADIYKEIASAYSIMSEGDYNAMVETLKNFNTPTNVMRDCYCAIKKYIVSKVWKIDIKAIDIEDIRKYYPKMTKLLNYKFFNLYTANNNKASFKNVKLEYKINAIHNILRKFGITNSEQFDFSIECGIGTIGRAINKKENPNIISSQQYNDIRNILMQVVKDKEFRFNFGLDKVEGEITNRQFLETIKKVISEFGFVLDVRQKFLRDEHNNIIYYNTYLIDLDNTILELLNLTSRDYFDDIVDGVSSTFNEDAYDEEKSNKNSENEIEFD